MDVFTGVIVYLLIWWVVLFAVLPWGVRTVEEPQAGHAPSAPQHPRLLRKLIATSLVSLVIWAVVAAIIISGLVDFNAMMRERYGDPTADPPGQATVP